MSQWPDAMGQHLSFQLGLLPFADVNHPVQLISLGLCQLQLKRQASPRMMGTSLGLGVVLDKPAKCMQKRQQLLLPQQLNC